MRRGPARAEIPCRALPAMQQLGRDATSFRDTTLPLRNQMCSVTPVNHPGGDPKGERDDSPSAGQLPAPASGPARCRAGSGPAAAAHPGPPGAAAAGRGGQPGRRAVPDRRADRDRRDGHQAGFGFGVRNGRSARRADGQRIPRARHRGASICDRRPGVAAELVVPLRRTLPGQPAGPGRPAPRPRHPGRGLLPRRSAQSATAPQPRQPEDRAGQSKIGSRVRVRFSSKNPSVPATSSTPSQSLAAASARGIGEITGPKNETPDTEMTGVPTL